MKLVKRFTAVAVAALLAVVVLSVISVFALPASAETAEPEYGIETYAEEENQPAAAADEATSKEAVEAQVTSSKAIAAAVAIGVSALAGAIAMGLSIAKAMDGISRQPEAAGNIRSTMMLGLVFVETVVIYALIVSVLLIFVL